MGKKIVRSRIKNQKKARKKSGSISLFNKVLLLVALLFITAFTVLISQHQQTFLEHAQVTTSNITPQFHCLTLGNSNCTGVASTVATTCAGLTVVTPLKLNRTSLEQGESIEGTIVYENECTIPYDVTNILISATEPPNAANPNNVTSTFIFTPSSGKMTVLPNQKVTVTGTLQIGATAPAGQWTAVGEFIDTNGTAHPDKTVAFTVCGPLTVSQKITLDKTTVNPGQTITGQITYKNACAAPFVIDDSKISARDPKANIDDFTPNTGPKTIAANGTLVIKASRAMTTSDPLGVWKAFGSYQNATGTWVVDTTLLSFTLAVPPPPPPAKKPAPGSTSKSCVAVLTKTATVSFDTYTGGTVTVPAAGDATLKAYATALKADKTITVTVDGYTDATPFAAGTTGAITNNQQLSLARANAVAAYLKSPGGATANKYTVKGDGVAAGATTNDAADRKAEVTSSCGGTPSKGGGTTSGGGGTGTAPVGGGTTKVTCTAGSATANAKGDVCLGEACGPTSIGTGTCVDGSNGVPGQGSLVPGFCPGPATEECYVPQTCNASDGGTCVKNAECQDGGCNLVNGGNGCASGETCIK